MHLSDLPSAEQQHFLDGITVGIATREARRPGGDKDRLDPTRGSDDGWWWRRGFDVGYNGRDPHEELAAIGRERSQGAGAGG